jgi:flagella basal body P-ring formation protein FlgA
MIKVKYLEELVEVTNAMIRRYLKVAQVLTSIYFIVPQVIVKGRYNSK